MCMRACTGSTWRGPLYAHRQHGDAAHVCVRVNSLSFARPLSVDDLDCFDEKRRSSLEAERE